MPDSTSPNLATGHRIGHYTITRQLGRGGMGVVYVARDERLDRDVALKMIAGLVDETAKSRFWREARVAASVNHPHICQVFEVDDSPDGVFLTMELLEGEPLDTRLSRSALAPKEAVRIAAGLLSALGALHGRGLVHRDIKPSNVFVTSHGPKLLDFGLARQAAQETVILDSPTPKHAVTEAGMIIGTPQYMAPEQVNASELDGRTDIYAMGALLFHMLAGRPPFAGTGMNVMFAALHENPPALQGPPEVVAIDRVIRRAMRKAPADRYATADAMARDLDAVAVSSTTPAVAIPVRALTRIIVTPVRIAKTDTDLAFLSLGLAEGISGSLASLENVVVRSPAIATRWSDAGDPRALAAEADVDLIVSNTLLRSGSQLRITVQLIEAMSGTVMGSSSVKGTLDDIFAVEDGLTTATIALLSARQPASAAPVAADAPTRRDVPASPRAFELFLRGLEHARHLTQTLNACEVLQEAVDVDPDFAPAWAMLGRCRRVYGKYYENKAANDDLAERAFRRALELSPDLPVAHRYFTHFEAEHGRAGQAVARLLKHARKNRNDAQLFAGLVHACRYAGLLDEAIAANDEAQRLDPNVGTSIEYVWAHKIATPKDAEGAVERFRDRAPDVLFAVAAFGGLDLLKDTIEFVDQSRVPPGFRLSLDAIRATAMEPPDEAARVLEAAVKAHTDPEALFLFGTLFVRIGRSERGIELMRDAVRSGYAAAIVLNANFLFEGIRREPAFVATTKDAERQVAEARAIFEAEGGPALLGM